MNKNNKQYHKDYYELNKEKILLRTKEYREKNRELIKQKDKKYNNKTYYPDFYFPEKDLYVEYAGLIGISSYDTLLNQKKSAMVELNKNYLIITEVEQMTEVLSL